MGKSTHFTGQPIFSQLINLIPRDVIRGVVLESGSDHYYKRFDTWHHLVTMLFSCYGHCNSLREVVTGVRALEGKLKNTGIHYFPARSTLSEANAKRNSQVFEKIYMELKKYWEQFFPDSQSKKDNLYIIDSTTIRLFQEIFKGNACNKIESKRKGGLKVHMAIQSHQSVPSVVHITQAAYNDVNFTPYLNLPSGSSVIMDRGYRDYRQYNQWTSQNIRWITRMHPRTFFFEEEEFTLTEDQQIKGIQKDERIKMGFPAKRVSKVTCRRITYKDQSSGKNFEFITNDWDSDPYTIAQLYKKRWRIELLFKRLKQNMPLQYFLGDNQNAIRIQIWSALIADLLLQIVRKQLKRKWAFSNIVSIVRLHLFNYLNLYSFLENPEKCIIELPLQNLQYEINLTG